MLWSDIPAEQAMQDEGFPISTACSWRLHALAPASRAPSHTFYASKVRICCTPPADDTGLVAHHICLWFHVRVLI